MLLGILTLDFGAALSSEISFGVAAISPEDTIAEEDCEAFDSRSVSSVGTLMTVASRLGPIRSRILGFFVDIEGNCNMEGQYKDI